MWANSVAGVDHRSGDHTAARSFLRKTGLLGYPIVNVENCVRKRIHRISI